MERVITDPQALGVAIREARLAHSWTQVDLAQRARVSRRFVQDIERGSRPGAELARVMAVLRALGRGIQLVEGQTRSFDDVLNEVLNEVL
jgi:transcriptional regulator with XRE-family HTH domain